MNNAEWMRLLRRQRQRASEQTPINNETEVVNNENVINNGDGNNNGPDAGNGAGGADSNPPQPPELRDNSGDIETGSSDNGDAQ